MQIPMWQILECDASFEKEQIVPFLGVLDVEVFEVRAGVC